MSCTEDTTLRTNYGCLLQLLGGIKCGYSLPEVDILPQKYLSFFFFLMLGFGNFVLPLYRLEPTQTWFTIIAKEINSKINPFHTPRRTKKTTYIPGMCLRWLSDMINGGI